MQRISTYKVLLIVIALHVFAAAGDFAYVTDPDRYVNIRNSPSLKSAVVDTVRENQCVERFSSNDGWTLIAVELQGSMTIGYVKASRLVPHSRCNGKTIEQRFGKCAVSTVEAKAVLSVKDISRWFENHSNCKESDALNTLSIFVTNELASKWKSSLLELGAKSAPLRNFVKELIAVSPSLAQLKKISESDCRNADDKQYCKELVDAATSAIK